MERKFDRELSALDNIFGFIAEFIKTSKVDDAIGFSINLAVEELFTNMVKYNPESVNEISISLNKDMNKLIITLIDFDVELFDVTKTKEVNTTQSLQDRQIGGLGIHLAKKMVDEISYEYLNRQSKITLTKKLER